ncbi:MAG TPA: pirin family protein [Gammaproteobacteria bacterium]
MNARSENLLPQPRPVVQVVSGYETSDGAGVRLTRLIGTPALDMLDPFLMLDAFRSDEPEDYLAGFPSHPHRGFETVTYLLAGKMRHHDNAGHAGVIEAGGVQWMSAGRGIIHSEMPEQENGLLAGFQLWVNLPASHKMMTPRYQEFGREAIPVEQREGAQVHVVAGTTSRGTQGPVRQLITDVIYYDITLAAGARFSEPLPADHNAFIHVVEGQLIVTGGGGITSRVNAGDLAILGAGARVELQALSEARLLLLAGQPLREPVAKGGPFVMNTQAELQQAYSDYRSGKF